MRDSARLSRARRSDESFRSFADHSRGTNCRRSRSGNGDSGRDWFVDDPRTLELCALYLALCWMTDRVPSTKYQAPSTKMTKLARELLFPLIAVLAAFIVGGLLILLVGDNPIIAYRLLL